MKKNGNIALKILCIVIILIVLIVAILAFFIYYKFSNINYEDIDKDDLSVNNNLYDDIKDTLEEQEITESEFNDIVSVALFGTDSRDVNNMSAGRSDCIMIASINPKNKSIKLISIPRDTYVNVPGYGKTKINHAYAYGGEQLSIKTINSNFGLNITEYITIDFSGLINIINEVGGIEMTISKEEMDVLNDYLKSSYKITGKTYVPMTEYGTVTLNGEQALAHSRDRYVGNDFDRANRQRNILTALFNKMSKMEFSKILSLSDVFLKEVKTNINVTEYMGLMTSFATNIGEYTNNIISAQVPNTEYASGKMINGIYYFVPDIEKSKQDMYKYIFEK